MYEYLKHMEYPPERGYDRKILESNCKLGRVNLKINRKLRVPNDKEPMALTNFATSVEEVFSQKFT